MLSNLDLVVMLTDDDDSDAEKDVKKEAAIKKEPAAENSDGVVPQIDKKKESTSTGFHMEPLMSASDEDSGDNGGSEGDDDVYRLFFANNHWYLLFRLHDILYERLHKISQQAHRLVDEEIACRKERKESTAIALRLKLPSAFLFNEMVFPFV
jgi:paired amphipathic helix protein Sin3a